MTTQLELIDREHCGGAHPLVWDPKKHRCRTCHNEQSVVRNRELLKGREAVMLAFIQESVEPQAGWDLRAACRGQDAIGYAYADADEREATGLTMAQLEDRRVIAMQSCPGCPVRAQCAGFALQEHAVGVWGGEYLSHKDWSAAATALAAYEKSEAAA